MILNWRVTSHNLPYSCFKISTWPELKQLNGKKKKYRDKIKEDPVKYQKYLEREKERYKNKKRDRKIERNLTSGNKDAKDDSGNWTKETKELVIKTERRYKVI